MNGSQSKVFPVIWGIESDKWYRLNSALTPIQANSDRNGPVVTFRRVTTLEQRPTRTPKRVAPIDIPSFGDVAFIEVIHDTRQNGCIRQTIRVHRVRRLRPTDTNLPTLRLVVGASRSTGFGGSTRASLSDTSRVIAQGYSRSTTGNHGQDIYLVLLDPGSTIVLTIDKVANITGNRRQDEYTIHSWFDNPSTP